MKSKDKIKERIEQYEQRIDEEVSGSSDWSRAVAYRNALQWVLDE